MAESGQSTEQAGADADALAAALDANDEELAAAVETLARLQRDETLDQLAALGDALTLLDAAVDDEMVVSLAQTVDRLGEVAETASEPDTAAGVERLLGAVGEADAASRDAERVGPLALVRQLRDPEVQAGLGYLLAVAKALGEDLESEGRE
jgi:uncharacterized protein YjgD (DUF1641 family)